MLITGITTAVINIMPLIIHLFSLWRLFSVMLL